MAIKKLGIMMPALVCMAMLGLSAGFLHPCGATAGSLSAASAKQTVPGASAFPASDASHRTITDMAGRKVVIPTAITKVLSTSPPPTTFIYMLAPDKLGGWMGKISDVSKKFIPSQYQNIPVVGWERSGAKYEAYIAVRPDLVFVGFETGATLAQIDLTQEKFGDIPVVCVNNSRNATGYGETITFMGEVLGVPERAKALVAYYEKVLKEVEAKTASIPEAERARVYYAEGENGLSTDPKGSVHSQLIDVCGGINVADCAVNSGSGMTPVTMESVLMWKPDVIITTSKEFKTEAANDESWQKVPAVQHQQIYLTPGSPFNWFDRPPGVNRIVGIPWTAHLLYPVLFPEDWFKAKVKEFYSLYYHYNLSDEALASLLKG